MDEKEIELAVGTLHHATKLSYPHEIILEEKLVCIGRPQHPLFDKKIPVKRYLAAKHVSFMPLDQRIPHIVDQVLQEMNLHRDVSLRVSHIMPAVYTLQRTDLIATVPESLANEVMKVLHFSKQTCAINFPHSRLAQMWHPWTQADPGCMWLRQVMKNVAKQLGIN